MLVASSVDVDVDDDNRRVTQFIRSKLNSAPFPSQSHHTCIISFHFKNFKFQISGEKTGIRLSRH